MCALSFQGDDDKKEKKKKTKKKEAEEAPEAAPAPAAKSTSQKRRAQRSGSNVFAAFTPHQVQEFKEVSAFRNTYKLLFFAFVIKFA